MPMRPGMTRWSIWPLVSVVFSSGPCPLSRARPVFDSSVRSRSLNA